MWFCKWWHWARDLRTPLCSQAIASTRPDCHVLLRPPYTRSSHLRRARHTSRKVPANYFSRPAVIKSFDVCLENTPRNLKRDYCLNFGLGNHGKSRLTTRLTKFSFIRFFLRFLPQYRDESHLCYIRPSFCFYIILYITIFLPRFSSSFPTCVPTAHCVWLVVG